MAQQLQLTSGFLSRVTVTDQSNEDLWTSHPNLQLLSVKRIVGKDGLPTPGTPERYRIIVSDGNHFLQAMLATQLNHLVHDDAIGKNTVATIDQLSCNTVQGKKLIIILALTVLGRTEEKIGTPVSLDMPAGQAPAAAAPVKAPSLSSAVPNKQQVIAKPQAPAHYQSAPSDRPTVPIESLSPYHNKWTIKARVTQKSDVRTWSNNKGEGKLFNVTLMDETGEIRATGFNIAVDEFYEKLQEGKVYFISKARVSIAKKKFSNLSNEYELSLDRGTEIDECLDTTNVPTIKYNFAALSDLQNIAKDSTCDVIGVVKEAAELSEIVSKTTNRQITKRELTLVDRSGFSVRLTLWGKHAEQYAANDQPIIAFKGVRVGDFGGRSLSMISSSLMTINPDIPEAHALRGWFDAIGSEQSFQSHTNTAMSSGFTEFDRSQSRTLNDVKEAQLGQSDKVDMFSTRATILHIKTDNLAYPGCPSDNCNKKVVEGNEGWRCEKCDQSYVAPQWRYILSMSVADHTGQAWLQGFNDVGEKVFGQTANELIGLRESDESQYSTAVQKAICGIYNFTCRAKQDTFNDQTRVRYGISQIQSLNYRTEASALREVLHSSWAQ